MLTAVTGINWGDEGKGRVIDLLAEHADIVVRYQGGNNAGHTVVNKQGKFVLNLLPSGILHPDVVCVLGDGMVIDLNHLSNEIAQIRTQDVSVSPKNLKLSTRATISMPWHKIQDELEEERLSKSGAAFGSTKRGIAYAYSDKYRKKTIRLGDLLHLDEENVQARLKTMLEAKNLELAGCYHQEPMSLSALLSWCRQKAAKYAPYITDTGASLDHVVGVLKAYSTCVGAGPFVAEKAMNCEWTEMVRKYGGEYGAATGRPRRVGPFDAVASRYGLKCQHADKIALTKLDVLSIMDQIPVITGYQYKNAVTNVFDPTENLEKYTPVVKMLPGWKTDISNCRSYDELPVNAKRYINFLEDMLRHEIQFVSVGAERNQYLLNGKWL